MKPHPAIWRALSYVGRQRYRCYHLSMSRRFVFVSAGKHWHPIFIPIRERVPL